MIPWAMNTLLEQPLESFEQAEEFLAVYPTVDGLGEQEKTLWQNRIIEGLALSWLHIKQEHREKQKPGFEDRVDEAMLSTPVNQEEENSLIGFLVSGNQTKRQKSQTDAFSKGLSSAFKVCAFTKPGLEVLAVRKNTMGAFQLSLKSMESCLEGMMTSQHRAQRRAATMDRVFPAAPKKPTLRL